MADPDHLRILKQGVEVWNHWREENMWQRPSLIEADLRGMDLYHADFTLAYLSGANLSGANLSRANLSRAYLWNVGLRGTDLSRSTFSYTIIGETDLGETRGLETAEHSGPSFVTVDTIHKSRGKIPGSFLRGCGLSDWEIEGSKLYNPQLSNAEITNVLYRIHDLRGHQAIQINPLFISYNHADGAFVDSIERHLTQKGIRFWRDIHHAKAGRLEKQIDQAIRLNPTVLLVLSVHSTESDWVQHEARLARKLEQEKGRDILCPIALDDSWKRCNWPERLREQIMEYNILDFSGWNDEETLRRMFNRLIGGLDMFYK